MQANEHAQPLPDLKPSDDLLSLGATPAASSAAAIEFLIAFTHHHPHHQ